MTTTALDLVNRMRAKRRDATSSIITDRQGVAYLEILNSAITTALEERTWNFQIRSDGYLKTVPTDTAGSANFTTDSQIFGLAGHSGGNDTLYGDFQTRIMVTTDANYGNTTFRVDRATDTGGIVVGVLAQEWPGTTTGSGTWKTLCWEYTLPSTVKQVISVVHQESPVTLKFEDEQYTFDQLVPTPQDYESDQPEFVMVGGEVDPTEAIATSASTYALALKVYPVPSVAQVLNYSYVYRQPKLTVLTDQLYRVPPMVEEQIVDLATARVIQLLEKDMQTGVTLEAKVLKALDRLHRNHRGDPARRAQMKSFDQMTGNREVGRIPRAVEGL